MFTATDYDKLRQIMTKNPTEAALIQKLLDSQEETLRTISHEIRNPLTMIYSTLQFLESEYPQLIESRHWLSLKEDTEYIKVLLEELSSYNNGQELSLSFFDFRSFMEQLSVSFATTLIDSSVEFTSYIASDLPYINGDRTKLKEVFLNLLRNASESIDTVGIIKLHVSYHNEEKEVHVKIEDSGCGIKESDLGEIFTPFVTHKDSGTGLGLAITKRIVDAHKGHIHVSSKIDLGSTFTISLPI